MTPEFIDNVNKTLKSSLKEEIKPGSKISIRRWGMGFKLFSFWKYRTKRKEGKTSKRNWCFEKENEKWKEF